MVDFWREAGPGLWFAKDAEFDRRFRERFLPLYEAAARGELGHWLEAPEGALALLVLLDQFPRNAFRGSAAHVRHRHSGARDGGGRDPGRA